ncbi:MAG: hypothetical protein J0L97_01565 [Alphaproteobacteria bacterium]|nr:hypothetical protein [Alphaproteobacteria bacterium]
MPQLDFSTFPSQLFWLLISLCFLYGLLSAFFLPKLSAIVEGRQQKIEGDLALAETLRTEAEQAKQHYEQALHEAQTRAGALLAERHKAAVSEEIVRNQELDDVISDRLHEAEMRLMEERKKAIKELSSVSVKLASQIVSKLTKSEPEEKAVRAVIEKVSQG